MLRRLSWDNLFLDRNPSYYRAHRWAHRHSPMRFVEAGLFHFVFRRPLGDPELEPRLDSRAPTRSAEPLHAMHLSLAWQPWDILCTN